MKPLKEVLKDRDIAYLDKTINTIHRSSLLIPKLDGNETLISFLNHFLIKRGIKSVALKISAYDCSGKTIMAKSFEIDEEKVYIYRLEEIFPNFKTHTYQIEFFSSKNLFIPFPAVMINHISQSSWNIVHSYNRILNDSGENEKISSINVNESAIDLINTEKRKTFVVFHTGQLKLKKDSKIKFTLLNNRNNKYIKEAFLNLGEMNKMSFKMIFINEIFKNLPIIEDPSQFTLKVKPPKQDMFYGRMLVGGYDTKTKSISGNHSYYDSSETKEYFENPRSFATYPYFENFINQISIYPIASSSYGELSFFATCRFEDCLKTFKIFSSEFYPHSSSISLNINKLVKDKNLSEVKTFSLEYVSKDNLGTPSRFSHQLIYASERSKYMTTSINTSLINDQLFRSNKKTHSWIQLINSKNINSKLGISYIDFDSEAINSDKYINKKNKIYLEIYNEKGLQNIRTFDLYKMDSLLLDASELCASEIFWVVAKSNDSILKLWTFHFNEISGYSSGEHGF